jgi:hypothetical protein
MQDTHYGGLTRRVSFQQKSAKLYTPPPFLVDSWSIPGVLVDSWSIPSIPVHSQESLGSPGSFPEQGGVGMGGGKKGRGESV